MKSKNKKIDWSPIKAEYLAGRTPKQIASGEHGQGLIAKQISERATASGWTKQKKQIANKLPEKIIEQVAQSIHEIREETRRDLDRIFKEIESRLDIDERATVADRIRYAKLRLEYGLAMLPLNQIPTKLETKTTIDFDGDEIEKRRQMAIEMARKAR